MTIVNWHIDVGQIVTSLLLLLIGWGLRQFYKLVSTHITRVNNNELTLSDTVEVVDQHSVTLVKAGLIPNGTVKKLHMGRRTEDPTYIVLDKERT